MKTLIITLIWILFVTPLCLGRFRNLEETLIITELTNSECGTIDNNFFIRFSNAPSKEFEQNPTVVLHSIKNGYLNATCATTMVEVENTLLSCTFDDTITEGDDYYFVNMTIPGYTYISNIPSYNLIRKSNSHISIGNLTNELTIFLSEPHIITIGTTEIYYEQDSIYYRIPCTSLNSEQVQCVLSQEFDLSTLTDNKMKLYYRDRCGDIVTIKESIEFEFSVYKINIPETIYVNLNEDNKTEHDLFIEVSTKSLDSITLKKQDGQDKQDEENGQDDIAIKCEKTSNEIIFKCPFTLEQLSTEKESSYTLSFQVDDSTTYETSKIVVSLFDENNLEIITDKQQKSDTITTATTEPLNFNFAFTKDIGTEIKDEPGYPIREIKMESNSLKSSIESCTIIIEEKAVNCTYYSPENATLTFSYKNSIGNYQKIGSVTVGSGSPFYYDSSNYSKINILFLFVFILIL